MNVEISNLISYFPFWTFLISLASGYYFLVQWLINRQRYLFYWSMGLFSFIWFQIPFILNHLNVRMVLTDFYPFFSFSFPMTFVGFVFVYLGVAYLSKKIDWSKMLIYFVSWFILCLSVYGFCFIVKGGTNMSYFMITASNILFFLPIRLLTLFTLWRWIRGENSSRIKPILPGIIVIIIACLEGLVNHIASVFQMLSYPPDLWYIALLNSKSLFSMEMAGFLLLISGFYLVQINYHKISDKENA